MLWVGCLRAAIFQGSDNSKYIIFVAQHKLVLPGYLVIHLVFGNCPHDLHVTSSYMYTSRMLLSADETPQYLITVAAAWW